MAQTTMQADPSVAYPGQPADSGVKDDISVVVEEATGIDPGLLVVRGSGGDLTALLPPAGAADDDGIVTTRATSASIDSLTTADANGALGAGPYIFPAKITMTIDTHADWDAVTAVLVLEDENGLQQSENLSIPDGGNTVLTSTAYARRFVSLTIPAQSGTGGSFTLGVSADVVLTGGDILGVSVRTHKARQDGSVVDAEQYEDEASMPVRRMGRIYVEVENAFEAGDRVFVRLTATGNEKVGAFRVSDDDSGDCVAWSRGRMVSSGAAGGVGVLEITA